MSAWIEISVVITRIRKGMVALLVSAWIEMISSARSELKTLVALLVSAWIEMLMAQWFVMAE